MKGILFIDIHIYQRPDKSISKIIVLLFRLNYAFVIFSIDFTMFSDFVLIDQRSGHYWFSFDFVHCCSNMDNKFPYTETYFPKVNQWNSSCEIVKLSDFKSRSFTISKPQQFRFALAAWDSFWGMGPRFPRNNILLQQSTERMASL